MYGLLIFLGIIAAILLYFCFGIVVKFLWGWFPIIFGGAVSVAMLFGSLLFQIIGVLLFVKCLIWTNSWHDTQIYTHIEEKIDKWFYFKD